MEANRIKQIETQFFSIPLKEPLEDAEHGIQTEFEIVVLTIILEDGRSGIGYTYTGGYGGRAIYEAVEKDLKRFVIGKTQGVVRIDRIDQRSLGRELELMQTAPVSPSRQNEFELHARAILGLPVNTALLSAGASAVIYGGLDEKGIAYADVDHALRVPQTEVRLFGKPESFLRRRMGVALAYGDDVNECRQRAKESASRVRPTTG